MDAIVEESDEFVTVTDFIEQAAVGYSNANDIEVHLDD